MERLLRLKLRNGNFGDVTPVRSRIMSAIRGKSNKSTELSFRMHLVRAKIGGFILHSREVLGRPDFYFERERLAVFVDGCFWHGCAKCGHVPKTNRPFWAAKIERNQMRDLRNRRQLRSQGVKVLRVWEHEIKEDVGAVMRKLFKMMGVARPIPRNSRR